MRGKEKKRFTNTYLNFAVRLVHVTSLLGLEVVVVVVDSRKPSKWKDVLRESEWKMATGEHDLLYIRYRLAR